MLRHGSCIVEEREERHDIASSDDLEQWQIQDSPKGWANHGESGARAYNGGGTPSGVQGSLW